MAVHMIRDMDDVEGAVMFPDATQHLVEPGFATLRGTLEHCNTGSCLKGALHALGHLRPYHTRRVDAMIDDFLRRRVTSLPLWLLACAEHARAGAA